METEFDLGPIPAPGAGVTRVEKALHYVSVRCDPPAQPLQSAAAVAIGEEHEREPGGVLRRQAQGVGDVEAIPGLGQLVADGPR
jgi:hypothetical protein